MPRKIHVLCMKTANMTEATSSCSRTGGRPYIVRQQLQLERADHALRYLVLHIESVVPWTVVTYGPEMRACLAVDKLPRDAHEASYAAYAALQQVVDVELAGH